MHYFHYTDINAVYSILKNRKLWLTDLRYMNDSSELRDGISYLERALDAPYEAGLLDIDGIGAAIQFMRRELNAFQEAFDSEEPLFVISLSSRDDMLSQWRAYGKYSLRLDADVLSDSDITIVPCVYGHGPKDFYARKAMTAALKNIAKVQCEYCQSIDEFTNLIDLAATFKNQGFEEESEARIIVKGNDSKVQYRPRGNMLVPYIELPIPPAAITGVRVGPIRDSHLSLASLNMFASEIEEELVSNYCGYGEYSLDVLASSIPFRE